MATIHTTYQVRGYLSKSAYAQLDNVLRQSATLYNAGLQEWRDSYSVHAGWQHWADATTNEPVRTRDGKNWVFIEQRTKRGDVKTPTHYDQLKEFTGVRADDPFWAGLDVNVGRGVLQRLERAKNAFFRRVKAGEKPGYPRFKSGRNWRTLEMAEVRSPMIRNGTMRIKGLPAIRIPSKRELPSSADLKTLRITRAGRRVMVSLGYAVERDQLPYNPACVGIDMGVTDRMVLSTGQVVMAGEDIPAAGLDPAEIPTSGAPINTIACEGVSPDVAESSRADSETAHRRWVSPDVAESSIKDCQTELSSRVSPDVAESSYRTPEPCRTPAVSPDVAESSPQAEFSEPHKIKRRRSNRTDIGKKQRRLAQCNKGSRRWRQRKAILANAHSRARISNRNACHRITTGIVRSFGHIGIEALQITNMTRSAAGTIDEPGRNVAAKSGLNREILTQTWGLIRQQLAYKAEWAGRRLVEVDPKYTSVTCALCSVIDAKNRNGKAFACLSCGHYDDADRNAAVNILRKSLAGGNGPAVGH